MNSDFIWCLRCNKLTEASDSMSFHTGFHQIDGVDYPLGFCSKCRDEALSQPLPEPEPRCSPNVSTA